MSENGEIYTAGKNFTLPPALTAWTKSTCVLKLLTLLHEQVHCFHCLNTSYISAFIPTSIATCSERWCDMAPWADVAKSGMGDIS